jgi:hypothetical protein
LVAKEKVPRASLQALPEPLELSRETPQPSQKHTRRLNSLSMNRKRDKAIVIDRNRRMQLAVEIAARQPNLKSTDQLKRCAGCPTLRFLEGGVFNVEPPRLEIATQ